MPHSYLLADIAIVVHARELIALDAEKEVPYPDWLNEAKAQEALRHSGERVWLGRY
jgi:phosphopantetheinyl transferase